MLSLPRLSRRTVAAGAGTAAFLALALWHFASTDSAQWSPKLASIAAVSPDVVAAAGVEFLPGRPNDVTAQTLTPLGHDAARARNAAIPFSIAKPQPARAFRYVGGSVDRARAVECLALAAIAEAGGGDPDQRAVIQVILNRVRHPAFAKSICGVVFEGSHLATGCQFSFTCDGSLGRQYSDAAWAAARRRAGEALDGAVFAPVGVATHYHTDWVHPVWSSKLEKIARIDTHLFFRWPGFWGSAAALRIAYRGGEPSMAQLMERRTHAPSSAVLPVGNAGPPPEAVSGDPDLNGAGRIIVRHPDGGAYLVRLSPDASETAVLAIGRKLCADVGSYCRVSAWFDQSAIPKGYPISPPARAKMSFSYVLDARGAEYTLFDCSRFERVARDSCLPAPL